MNMSKRHMQAVAKRTGRRVVDTASGTVCDPSTEGEEHTRVEVKQGGRWFEKHEALARILTGKLWRGGQFSQLPDGRWLYEQSATCLLLIDQRVDVYTLRRLMLESDVA